MLVHAPLATESRGAAVSPMGKGEKSWHSSLGGRPSGSSALQRPWYSSLRCATDLMSEFQVFSFNWSMPWIGASYLGSHVASYLVV